MKDEFTSFFDMASVGINPISSMGDIWFYLAEVVNGKGSLYLMARVGDFDIVCRSQELTHANITDLTFEMCNKFGLKNPFEC